MGKKMNIYIFRCNSDCTAIETGYNCPTAGTACYAICGDSLYVDGEACEDGAYANNDGCSSTCKVEKGWSCDHHAGSLDTCKFVCGDGYYIAGEVCEDGNKLAGDGCYKDCTVEDGWNCKHSGTIAVDTCKPICGNGKLIGSELCDDGNDTDGDGYELLYIMCFSCYSDCTKIERGYYCPIPGDACYTTCGDGIYAGSEICDDGNTTYNDGCYKDCTGEAGWQCLHNTNSADSCLPICGDGLLKGSEQCDDKNTNSGDG